MHFLVEVLHKLLHELSTLLFSCFALISVKFMLYDMNYKNLWPVYIWEKLTILSS
jgi:hypothetical protein